MNNIKFFTKGFTDSELEKLSEAKEREFLNIAPWVCWESENASFGKCFRKWAFYPGFLPLFLVSPHGAYSGSTIWPNEIDGRVDLFWGWPKKKVLRRILEYKKKKSYTTIHPYIFYRRKYIGSPPSLRKGILYFYPHSNDHLTPTLDFDKLIKNLKFLDKKYNGLSVCLSFHDIRKGLHKKFRKYSFPIVTAGNTNSSMFVDRFYKLIYQYKFTCSSHVASQVYYCIEAGIQNFMIGEEPIQKGSGIMISKKVVMDKNDYGDKSDLHELKLFYKSLKFNNRYITKFQKQFVLNSLGYYDTISRYKATLYLWKELFLNIHKVIYLYFNLFFKVLKKLSRILIGCFRIFV